MALRKSIIRRFVIVYIMVILFFVIAIIRMVIIMTSERQMLLEMAEKREGGKDIIKTTEIAAERGNILSCDEELITANIPYYNVFIDLSIEPLTKNGGKIYKENVDSLCICLSNMFKDWTVSEYKNKLDAAYTKGSKRCRLSPRKVTYIELCELKKFPILRRGRFKGGFYYEVAPIRENLYGSLASRTIGNINLDNKGIYGLESFYDSLLAGTAGISIEHRSGIKWVKEDEKDAVRGVDVITTLDLDIQEICETALRNKLEQVKAKSACVIVMEVKTGAIKAMVNLMRTSKDTYIEGWNMAVADMSEPGSTFKTMSLMIALDSDLCDTSDIYDVGHGRWDFYENTMTDHNWKKGGYDPLTVSEILANSSNVGVSRIIDENYADNPAKFVDAVLATKFAENINIQIPGSEPPVIPHPATSKEWSKLSLPWMSIGYVAQIPPIYTLNFYNAIANGGKMMRPYLVQEVKRGNKVIESYSPEVTNPQICKESTLSKIQGMLEGVVERGTAKSIKSDVFKIAGKTGTAQLNYGKRGVAIHHQVSFCGYFPADNPLYSCIVVVKEPQMAPAAAFISGEVFKKSAERIYAKKNKLRISEIDKWDDINNGYNNPQVKGGKNKAVEKSLKHLGIDHNKDNSEWIVIKEGSDHLQAEGRPLLDNRVPDVKGMGLTDAVYLLEQRGMYVQVYGKGRVVSQSIRPGKDIEKGSTVTLELR